MFMISQIWTFLLSTAIGASIDMESLRVAFIFLAMVQFAILIPVSGLSEAGRGRVIIKE
jgi:hypothetical protein